MEIWKSKNYCWLIPLLACVLVSLAFLSYNFFPTMITYILRRVAFGIFAILFFPLFLCFIIAAVSCGYKILRKQPISTFLKFCLVSPTVVLASIFVVGNINESAPISRLDPYMQLNQFSREIWEDDELQRRTMIGDLIENVLPSKSCAEIETLLGESLDKNFGNQTKPFRCHSKTESELRYFLGSRGLFGDMYNIQIFFDEAGLYSHSEIFIYDW